jgi:hypothetical protein
MAMHSALTHVEYGASWHLKTNGLRAISRKYCVNPSRAPARLEHLQPIPALLLDGGDRALEDPRGLRRESRSQRAIA